jgi:hypothetical protein
MSTSSAILENFIHDNYPGLSLPPLWQVIYQEATRGHHLLFRRDDTERYEAAALTADLWQDQAMTDNIESVIVEIIGCADLQGMVRLIDSLSDDARRGLYLMYRRVLWMWRHYVKEQMN